MDELRHALAKLKRLTALPSGWNYGSGGAPSARAVGVSAVVLQYLSALNSDNFDVLPTDSDGVTILASYQSSLAEILVRSDGLFDLFLEVGNDDLEYPNLDFGDLTRRLEDAGWRSMKSFGSRTHVFTVQSTDGSLAPLLRSVVTARRSFVQHASRKTGWRSVNTSADTILDSEVSPQSSAEFLPKTLATTHG